MSTQYITLLAKYHNLCFKSRKRFTMPAMTAKELGLYFKISKALRY